MRRALLIASLLSLSTLHCGPGPGMYSKGNAAPKASTPASGSGKTFDFETEMKKEATGLKPFPISAPDGAFTATVSAAAQPKVSATDERSVSFSVDIGSKRPIDCAVFSRRIDTATTLWKLVAEPIANMPTKEVLKIDMGADEDRPRVTLHMAALNEKREVHVLKATVVQLFESTVVCQHEEVGYAATATAAALELARTMKRKTPAVVPRFHDFATVKFDGAVVGWMERVLLDRPDGTSVEGEYGGLLMAKDAVVVANDDATATEVDRDGLVKSLTKGEGGPKGLTTKLAVVRKGATEYEAEGELHGEKLHTTLKTKRPLRGLALVSQDIVANAHASSAAPFTEETLSWATKEVSLMIYTRTPKFDANAPTYAMKDGEDEYTAAFDAQGVLKHLEGKIGGVAVEATRHFAKGNPQRKK